MFLRQPTQSALRDLLARLLIVWLMLCILASATLSAWAQSSGGATPATPPATGGGVVWKICDPPPICFKSKAAKEKWAEEEHCRFIEDVCEKTTPEQDKEGLKPENQGIFGKLWDLLKDSGLRYGAEFITGLYAGLRDQVADLVRLFTDTADVIEGLVQLGKAFFDDPKGTLASLGELLGQEAVDAITKATQCSAYDLGKVIATYVNPYFAVKLAQRLTKYGGKLAEAAKAVKHDYGCVSFAAGTPVFTPNGLVPIEQITVGQQVLSRNEHNYADRPQAVTHTMNRQASNYRLLTTEDGSYRVTGEHPLWLQGKGWTPAAQVQPDDVLAGERLDSLVIANRSVAQPLRVYNLSVGITPSYFVGTVGVWVHNISCDTRVFSKSYDDLKPHERGFRGEYDVFKQLLDKGMQPVGKSFDPRGKDPQELFAKWYGSRGIDGIYKDADGNYIIIESKAMDGEKPGDPEGCKAKLCMTKNSGRQLSKNWVNERLKDLVDDPDELAKIQAAMKEGKVKKIYAQTDHKGTTYHEVVDLFDYDVELGKEWRP